jgi:hypothetical protein
MEQFCFGVAGDRECCVGVAGDRPVSQRTGLRERISKIVEPIVAETWTSEEHIELWKLKEFAEKFVLSQLSFAYMNKSTL